MEGQGGLEQRFQVVKKEPDRSGGADVGKNQNAAAFGIGFDLYCAVQNNARLSTGLLRQFQGLLQSEGAGREAAAGEVGGGKVEGHTGGSNGFNGHKGASFVYMGDSII